MTRQIWVTRAGVALASFLAAAVVISVAGPALSARADDAAGPGLDFVGFVQSDQMDCGALCRAQAVRALGDDPDLGMVLFLRGPAVVGIDAKTLQQRTSIALGTFIPQSSAVDVPTHRLFLGAQPQFCAPAAVQCAAGPNAVPAQIRALDLTTGTSTTYSLPSSFDGYTVIALTTVDKPDGGTVVDALLFRDDQGGLAGQAHSTLTLAAFDADKLDDAKTAQTGDALLWSWPIPSCASTPSYAVSGNGDTPEFLGADPNGRYAYFVCRGFNFVGQVTQAGAVVVDFPEAFPAGPNTDGFATSFYPYGANVGQAISGGDQTAGNAFLTPLGVVDKVYIFNSQHRAWVGSAPFNSAGNKNLWAVPVDPSTGRVYIIMAHNFVTAIQSNQIPVPQGGELTIGDFVPTAANGAIADPLTHRLFIARNNFTHTDGSEYAVDDLVAVYQDTRPPADVTADDDPDALTHDIDVTNDTPVTYGSFASGYGARTIVVGGAHSSPLGQFLPGGGTPAGITGFGCDARSASEDAAEQSGMPSDDRDQFDQAVPCLTAPSTSDGSRTITFGEVSDTELTTSASTADAAQFGVDDGSSADQAALTSYNPADDLWNRFVSSGSDSAGGGAPTDPATDAAKAGAQPAIDGFEQQSAPATCSDYGGASSDQQTPGALAKCHKDDGQTDATAVGPDFGAGTPLQIGYSASWTSVGHTSSNAAVTTASAVAKGVTLTIPQGPTISIGEAAATAASTAAGRPGTATSSFARSLSDVVVRDQTGQVVFSCGFADTDNGPGTSHAACDLRQLTDAVDAEAPVPVEFLTPSPDPDPKVTGSPGGAQAEVIKSKYEYWNDFNTNADNGYEIPALEIVLVGDTTQPSRVVLQLAGVHVESHDAIGLPPPPLPDLPDPSLKIGLVDGSAKPVPLAGGDFALVADDGTTAATCSTAADGIGTCAFPDVKPGSYTIKETKAPPGYAAAPDYPLTLDPGQDYLAQFVNLPAIGSVHVALTSAVDSKPLSGATFAMYAGSSTLGTPVGTCKTGKDGSCGFTKVPLASYTMHQQSAPKGFLLSKDVPFDLTDPGQDATLTFVDGTPAVKASTGTFIPGKPAVPPHTEVIGGGGKGLPIPSAPGDLPPMVSSTPSAQAPVVAGLPQRLANLPAQLAKLLTQSPQQAVLLLFMWLVFGLPVYLWARRRQLITATEGM